MSDALRTDLPHADPVAGLPGAGVDSRRSRRSMLKVFALGAGAATLAACETSSQPAATQSAAAQAAAAPSAAPQGGAPQAVAPQAAGGESILDRWVRTKKARVGIFFGSPPLGFLDPQTKLPSGYIPELLDMMFKDLEVTPEYIDTPFPQLFTGLAADKFDMLGQAVTITPARALRGWFVGMPAFYEGIVVILRPNSAVSKADQLNAASLKIGVLQGSSQQSSGKLLFPKAQFPVYPQVTDGTNDLAAGRIDAFIFSEFQLATIFKDHPDLKVLPGGALFTDANAWFIPAGDVKLWQWMTNWVRYQATHRVVSGLWTKWVSNDSYAKFGIPLTTVGQNGEPHTE